MYVSCVCHVRTRVGVRVGGGGDGTICLGCLLRLLLVVVVEVKWLLLLLLLLVLFIVLLLVVVVVVVVVVLGIRVDSVHAQVGLAKGAVDASAAVHRAGLLLVLDARRHLLMCRAAGGCALPTRQEVGGGGEEMAPQPIIIMIRIMGARDRYHVVVVVYRKGPRGSSRREQKSSG
jgi:hypothetical protein